MEHLKCPILGCPRRNLRDSKWKLGHIGKLPVIWLLRDCFMRLFPPKLFVLVKQTDLPLDFIVIIDYKV